MKWVSEREGGCAVLLDESAVGVYGEGGEGGGRDGVTIFGTRRMRKSVLVSPRSTRDGLDAGDLVLA
jgi:hypothetical protein